MKRIRYKYRPEKEGMKLSEVRCPVCGNPMNKYVSVNDTSWDSKVVLLAECWSGSTDKDEPRHLFLIEIEASELPKVIISKTGGR